MTELLTLKACTQIKGSGKQELVIVENISLALHQGEILGLVGRSGSGKSSLLEVIAGLASPSGGEVLWEGKRVTTAQDYRKISSVLQGDVLFPWLTVRQNIALALKPRGIRAAIQQEYIERAIILMDLDGYEGAYPKELSPTLRQRSILARALVSAPEILLLDEPFLDLEPLSAENLRTDLVELWSEHRLISLRAMVLATRSVEEAVLMCDRILLFSSGPGRITHEIIVPFPHPRDRLAGDFRNFVDQIYTMMTRRAPVISEAFLPHDPADGTEVEISQTEIAYIALPDVSIELMIGLLEVLGSVSRDGRIDLPELARHLQMTLDDLLPLGEILQMLDFAELEDGDLILTDTGRIFTQDDADARRDLMRTALLHALPLLRDIRGTLDERPNHMIDAAFFRKMLENHMSETYARQSLNTAIGWARYAGLFSYDEEEDRLFLESED